MPDQVTRRQRTPLIGHASRAEKEKKKKRGSPRRSRRHAAIDELGDGTDWLTGWLGVAVDRICGRPSNAACHAAPP